MTTPDDVLRSMFEHHLWATERLIEHLTKVPSERLDEAVPGTYGSMIATLTHLIDADTRYLQRLETLRAEMPEHRRRWGEMLDRLERGELHAAVVGKQDYPDTDPAETMLLIQAIHHGNDHRTQICSTLGALGLEVPELDGWSYWALGR